MLARVLQARDRGLTMVFTRTKRTAAKVADELDRARLRRRRRARRPRARAPASRRCARSAPARSTCWWPPTSRPAASTSRTSRTSSTTSARKRTRPTSTGSAAPAGPARPASRCPSSTGTTCPRWKLINESLGLDFADPAETYSTSKHLFADLDIPEGTTGGCRARSGPAPVWTPRRSRTWARPAASVAAPAGPARRSATRPPTRSTWPRSLWPRSPWPTPTAPPRLRAAGAGNAPAGPARPPPVMPLRAARPTRRSTPLRTPGSRPRTTPNRRRRPVADARAGAPATDFPSPRARTRPRRPSTPTV